MRQKDTENDVMDLGLSSLQDSLGDGGGGIRRFVLIGCAATFVALQWLLVRDASPLVLYNKEDDNNDPDDYNFISNTSTTTNTSSTSTIAVTTTSLPNNLETRLALELQPRNTIISQNPLICHQKQQPTSDGGEVEVECCASSWEVVMDDWWIHKPDWEVTVENETTYCVAPMRNQEKAAFLRQVHQLQWASSVDDNNNNCDQVETSVQINAGFGSSTRHLLFSFWHALHQNKPFQLEWNNRRWLYSTANQSSWAYCPSEDIVCYYLPISPCNRNITLNKGQHLQLRPNWKNTTQTLRFFWLEYYLLRPKHIFRRKLYEMRSTLDLADPCTTMHIRRGDSGMKRPPYRRYAAVQEYIDKANLQQGDHIFLLTDDQTTIEEIQKYHESDYNWLYLDRPRNRGIEGGFDGHIASGDEGFEMLAIETELRVARSCQKIVCGESGFMKSLVQSMTAEGRNYSLYYVDTRMRKGDVVKVDLNERVKGMLEGIEDMNQKRIQEKVKAEGGRATPS